LKITGTAEIKIPIESIVQIKLKYNSIFGRNIGTVLIETSGEFEVNI